MSTVLERAATPPAQPDTPRRRLRIDPRGPIPPSLVAAVSATAFAVLRPEVSDLQAALARQSAAAHGVGLSYWFGWFGGGATPGSYSVITPYLSTVIGAVLVGAVATAAITPLAWIALSGAPHRTAGTWVATYAFGASLWSGRVPFALGCALAIAAVIAFRARRPFWTALAVIAACLASPVCGAFLAFGYGSAALVNRGQRAAMLWFCAGNLVILVFIGWYFGQPGDQGYPWISVMNASFAALFLQLARPAPEVRLGLWFAAVAPTILALFPNGMGTNFNRYSWICLPAVVVATAMTRRKWLIAIAVTYGLACCSYQTIVDELHAARQSSLPDYYAPLISQIDGLPELPNCRLEVVQDPVVHTAARLLIDHVAIAGGWETQEAHELNAILDSKTRLNRDTYKIWLDNNAVCYLGFNTTAKTDSPEWRLVAAHRLPYLHEISRKGDWVIYRVADSTPIVSLPEVLVDSSQAHLTISVPCTCTFPVRVRFSSLLTATTPTGDRSAKVADDGFGWTTVTTTAPGMYVLRGQITHRLN